MFHVHKPGQAKVSRMVTLLATLFLILWGCRSLLLELRSFQMADHSRPLDRAWNEILLGAGPADAWSADLIVIQSKFSPALTICAAFLVASAVVCFWMLNRPRLADQLIEMETELRKVSWPTFSDAWQSTLVVSGFTALIVFLVFFYDIVIKGIVDLMPVNKVGI